MSCSTLADGLLRPGELDLLDRSRRQEVVDHLRGCRACRRRAVEIDPTVAFCLVEAPEIEGAEVAEIGQTVRAMRRMRDLAGAVGKARHRPQMTAAAVLMLAAALLLLPGGAGRRLEVPRPSGEAAGPPAPIAGVARQAPATWFDRPTASLIEDLDRPLARVYQLTEDDLSLVMIVDETLDL